MSRSDAMLNTGLTSNQAAVQRARRDARTSEKEIKRNRLLPVAEIINDELDRILVEVAKDGISAIHADMNKEDVKSIILGTRLAEKHILNMRTRLNNILRVRGDIGEDDE